MTADAGPTVNGSLFEKPGERVVNEGLVAAGEVQSDRVVHRPLRPPGAAGQAIKNPPMRRVEGKVARPRGFEPLAF